METKAPKGDSRAHSQHVAEPGLEPGNVAPELTLGDGPREGSRVAHPWQLGRFSLGVLGAVTAQWAASGREVLGQTAVTGFGRTSSAGVEGGRSSVHYQWLQESGLTLCFRDASGLV